MEDNQPQPPRTSTWNTRTHLVVAAGVALALLVTFGMFSLNGSRPPKSGPSQSQAPLPTTLTPPIVPPIDLQAIRRRAWDKIAIRLTAADAASASEIHQCLKQVDSFFVERKPGVKAFAKDILSLKGKWKFVRSRLPRADSDAHFQFLNAKFDEHVFQADELKVCLQSAIRQYVSSVEGIENSLLVECRADISDLDPVALQAMPVAGSQDLFSREYKKLTKRLAVDVARDLGISVGKEVLLFVATDIATIITIRVGVAVATKLGIDAGILSAGAASSWATFGVSIVAAIVLDIAINWLVRIAGHNAETQLIDKVGGTLDHIKGILIEGDPEAVALDGKLRHLEEHDPDSRVRQKANQAATTIEASGALGLKFELLKLHRFRSKLREAALKKLILEGSET